MPTGLSYINLYLCIISFIHRRYIYAMFGTGKSDEIKDDPGKKGKSNEQDRKKIMKKCKNKKKIKN